MPPGKRAVSLGSTKTTPCTYIHMFDSLADFFISNNTWKIVGKSLTWDVQSLKKIETFPGQNPHFCWLSCWWRCRKVKHSGAISPQLIQTSWHPWRRFTSRWNSLQNSEKVATRTPDSSKVSCMQMQNFQSCLVLKGFTQSTTRELRNVKDIAETFVQKQFSSSCEDCWLKKTLVM